MLGDFNHRIGTRVCGEDKCWYDNPYGHGALSEVGRTLNIVLPQHQQGHHVQELVCEEEHPPTNRLGNTPSLCHDEEGSRRRGMQVFVMHRAQ